MVSTKTLFVLLTAVASAYAQQTPDIVTLLDNPALSSLKSLITSYPDLVQTLAGAKDITVFAPSNEAIQKLTASPEFQAIANDQDTIKNILTYHVAQGVVRSTDLKETPAFAPTLLGEVEAFRNISGEPQVVKAALDGSNAVITSGLQTESTVTQADVAFTGGVAHIIDTVLAPPVSVSMTATQLKLTKLVEALQAANLVDTVDSLAKVTIFAPSDEAFGKLTATPSEEQLADILTYHVVPNAVGYSTELEDGQKLKTVQGGELTVRINNGEVTINGAKVAVADVLVNSGVVHVIDTVLVPGAGSNSTSPPSPSGSATGIPQSTGGAGIFGWSGVAALGGLVAAAWGMM